MNIDKLLDYTGGLGPEFDHDREVVTRLEDALGSQLDLNQSLMLIQILTSYTFVYDDGFIINDDGDLIRIIGYSDAAAIVAAFWDEPAYDWEWFKAEYFSDYLWSVEATELKKIKEELLASILQNPAVKLQEYDNEHKRRERKRRKGKPLES